MTNPPVPLVIAVDGPVAAGKGTLARAIAQHLNLAYLDTGLLYRAVAAKAQTDAGPTPDEAALVAAAQALVPQDLTRPNLRAESISQCASQAAAIAGVRAALLDYQRAFAANPPQGKAGAVLDGRDIGTVVCPKASVKLFITASPAARAQRRYKELLQRGEKAIYARVLEDLEARDARDASRSVAPLKAADDAIVIDTSLLEADQVLHLALARIKAIRAGA